MTDLFPITLRATTPGTCAFGDKQYKSWLLVTADTLIVAITLMFPNPQLYAVERLADEIPSKDIYVPPSAGPHNGDTGLKSPSQNSRYTTNKIKE
jgi:hypothetical protein